MLGVQTNRLFIFIICLISLFNFIKIATREIEVLSPSVVSKTTSINNGDINQHYLIMQRRKGTDEHLSSNRSVGVLNETFPVVDESLQQSDSINIGIKEASLSGLEASQDTILTDSGMTTSTNGSILSISPIVVSKKPSNHKPLHQALNTSHTCYYKKEERMVSFSMPHFIIAGAQKAGTSAISEFISDIPGFLRTTNKEGHFLDVLSKQSMKWKPNAQCKRRKMYSELWDSELIQADTILYEKSPRLIARTQMVERISVFLPKKTKIIVILRDPVERMYSHYKMAWQDARKRPDFPSVEDDIKQMVKTLIEDGAIQAPLFSNEITEWNQTDFVIGAPLTDYALKPIGRLARGFYAQQIKNYMEFFPLDDLLKVIHYESFLKNKAAVLQDLLDFVGGPSSYKFLEERLNDNIRPNRVENWYPPMTNKTKLYLKYLYKPFNDKLADLLGESWRGVWD